MAAVTPETVLEKISHGHLECPICLERFTVPKILKCRHNVCTPCLEKMMKAQPRQTSNLICCPVCRQNTVLPKTGIAGLDGNFSLMALVDEVNQQEMLLKRQKSRLTCELCVEKKQASVRCLDCSEYLCHECHKTHKRMKKTIAHEVVTIDDLCSGKATYESHYRKEVPKCKKHDQQEVLFFCITCGTLICTACAAVDHRSHDVQNNSEASANCKQQISHLLEKVEEKLKTSEAAKDKALESLKDHTRMVLDKQKVITQKADEEVARIRENERRLKKKVSEMSIKKKKQFQDLLTLLEETTKQTKDTLDRVKNDTFKITDYDCLKMKDSILHDLKDAEGRNIPDPVRCLTSEDFTMADLDVLNVAKQRPPLQPRPEKYTKVGKKVSHQVTEAEAAITPVEVSDQVFDFEAVITPVEVRDQVFEFEAAINPVEVRDQVFEDEAAITPVEVSDRVFEFEDASAPVEVSDPVIEDEAATTPVEKKEGIFAPPRKIDKTKWRRVIGGPQQS